MRTSSLAGRVGLFLLELVAPARCAGCGAGSREPFCESCGAIERAPAEELDGYPLLTLGRYASPLREAISRFKFGGHPELATAFAALLDAELARLGVEARDVFVPVPLHVKRLAERGYNQSALLARALAKRHHARFAPRLLERTRETEQQARLSRESRSENVAHAFRVRGASREVAMSGRVILVDDVVTTGATLSACLTALDARGVKVLGVIALARAGTPEPEGRSRRASPG
jgi:ComF family protein